MTAPTPESIAARHDEHIRCFTYCGDEHCRCPAREAYSTLGFVASALPVLSTMCAKAGLSTGARKAAEMDAEVRTILERQTNDQA